MPNSETHYAVALSFLSRDESIASALYNRLSEGLAVFFYPRNQEELAGTDGLESMRRPFLDDSRNNWGPRFSAHVSSKNSVELG
jgi:hypothetical protein